jgi:hypothetical protein
MGEIKTMYYVFIVQRKKLRHREVKKLSLATVAHTCNPSYSEAEIRRITV